MKNPLPRTPSRQPLGLYLHLPFCDARCPYCAFYSVPSPASGTIDAYLEALEMEGKNRRATLPRKRRPTTVYFGGGTPSLLSAQQLKRLCAMVNKVFTPETGAEWTVECNPGFLDGEKLAVLTDAGVNRISLGAQSLDDAALRSLGRRHNAASVFRAAEKIVSAGMINWSLDIIACVPGVGERRWNKILQQAAGLPATHFSVYALTLEEGRRLPASRARRSPPGMIGEDRQLRVLRVAEDMLSKKGYHRYEISNYALKGYQCRHHQDCWSGADYIGLGAGAVSRMGLARRSNAPDLNGYLTAFQRGNDVAHDYERLTPRLQAAENLVFGLRRMEGIDFARLNREHDLPLEPHAWPQPALRLLLQQGLLWRRKDRIGLTARGSELADAVALELWPDPDVHSSGEKTPTACMNAG